MKISIRRKIIFTFFIFILVSGATWLLGYYKYYVLNQKLQIIQRKNSVFNDILEARRYEKNFFISLDPKHLEDALTYVSQAQQKLMDILQRYHRFTLAKDLGEKLDELREYRGGLSSLLTLYRRESASKFSSTVVSSVFQEQDKIRNLGRRITEDMEVMIEREHRNVKHLISASSNYFVMELAAIFVLSCFTALFLVINVNRPLKSIENAIHKIAQGDFNNIPPISTGDEFESLVGSLNSMITELNRRNDQLVQSEKMASLGTLTSGVAHELNNPLNNISTSLQIMIEELEEGDLEYQRELLQETEKQIERARDIVKALLEFSRERSFALKPVRFKDLVGNTIKLIKGEMPANVELRLDVPSEIQGKMDPRRIQQILINLILNGVQAMEEGGVLSIRAYEQRGQRGFCFEVQDTGRGIPPENLPKIFDPFFTTKQVGQGAGLGLSVSHGIIERHGGRIDVKSEIGRGTTFTVFLPTDGIPAFEESDGGEPRDHPRSG